MDYDKRRLITGSMDRSIVVYDVRNGEFIKKLKGHKVNMKGKNYVLTNIIAFINKRAAFVVFSYCIIAFVLAPGIVRLKYGI